MTFIIESLLKMKTPFYSSFIDITGDIGEQKKKMSEKICEHVKEFTTYHEEDKNGKKTKIYHERSEEQQKAMVRASYKQHENFNGYPNAVIYKIPKNIIIVDTDDEFSDKRVRRILTGIFGEEMVNKYATPSISRALGVNMSKGYHYYFERDENLNFHGMRIGLKEEETGAMDVLGNGGPVAGWIIEHYESNIVYNSEDECMNMTNELLEQLTGQKQRRDSERNTETEGGELEEKFKSLEVWEKFVEMMPNEIESYDDWLSVMMFFKHYFPMTGFDVFSEWSEKFPQHLRNKPYSYSSELKSWNSLNGDDTTMGTIVYLFRKYHREPFENWMRWVNERAGIKPKVPPFVMKAENVEFAKDEFFIDMDTIRGGIYDIAEVMKGEIRKRAVYCLDAWYIFNDDSNLWMTGKVQPTTIIAQTIRKYFLKSISLISSGEVAVAMKEEEAIKFYIEQKKKLDTPSSTSQFTAHLRTLVLDNEFKEKLNQTRGRVVYKNGIYDIATDTFRRGITYQDYLTFTLPFDYMEATPEDKKRVEEILMKTNSQDREKYEYYIKMLGYSMTGYADRLQCSFFCNGISAGNGKSLIFETLSSKMTGYVKKLQTDCFEKDNSKRHKQFNDIDSCRILWVNEISDKQQDVSLIKDISDGVPFMNEVLYGTEKKVEVQAKVFFVSNREPKFCSDEGIRRRYRYVEFCSKFFDDEEKMREYLKNGTPNPAIHYIKDATAPEFLKSDNGMSALLSIIYDGARLFLRDGLKTPARYEELKESAIRANNNYADFIDNFREREGDHIHKDELARYWEWLGIKSKFNLADCIQAFREKGYVYDGKKQKKINKSVKSGFLLNMEFIGDADSEDE